MDKLKRYNRHSIRLKGYDYSSAGAYFITICTQNRENLFGKIENGKMIFNNAGEMVDRIYNELENYHKIKIDKYIIMPNHFHGIIEITVGAESISVQNGKSIVNEESIVNNESWADMESAPTSHTNCELANIIQTFKRYTTIEYIKMVKKHILPPFNKRIWQRNYWEHIIRNNDELIDIRKYIKNNPENWKSDSR
ncbi:MAG: transposase [Spirochaetes bacterium]|nr:transposase [Spirochaetales bacterium]MCK5267633.1 transposase [Spirochaetota bacterium]